MPTLAVHRLFVYRSLTERQERIDDERSPVPKGGKSPRILSVSSHHIQRLCEAGLIEAELTAGKNQKRQMQIPPRQRQIGSPPEELNNAHVLDHAAVFKGCSVGRTATGFARVRVMSSSS